MSDTQNTPIPAITPVKKPRGRPKGSTKKTGLSFEKRMAVLQKIALDNMAKDSDRLAAIKLITDLLSDKVKITDDNNISSETIIRFEQAPLIQKIENKPLIPENNTENIYQNITKKEVIPLPELQPQPLPASIPQSLEPIVEEQVIDEDNKIFNFNFNIGE